MYKAHETRFGWLLVLVDPKDGENIDTGFPFMQKEEAQLWARIFNTVYGIY